MVALPPGCGQNATDRRDGALPCETARVSGQWREQRRSRRLLRRMDRAARRAAAPGPRVTARTAVWLTVAAVTVGSGAALRSAGWELADIAHPRAYLEIDGRPVAVPRPGPSDGRLLPAVPATTTGSHAFLHVLEDGSPVGYDPCRPVHYVVRPDGMPGVGESLIEDAVAIVSAASGIMIVAVGTTDEAPAMDRAIIQPDRYGDGWAPVLIAWSDEGELTELAGSVAGVGGSAAVPGADGDGTWLAAGRLALDTAELNAILTRGDGYEQARAVVVHELAHVLGLDHVSDPNELMHPITSTRTDLGPGDLQGLALLGQVACEE